MTNNNPVRDNELLYRRIKDNEDHIVRHSIDKQGELEINPNCFFDRCFKPSVYRAELMNFNARLCRISITDGVVGFTAGNVRSIEIKGYKVKVCADPIDTADCKPNSDKYVLNKAHAIIRLTCIDDDTPLTEKRAFYILIQALSAKAKPNDWIQKPHS